MTAAGSCRPPYPTDDERGQLRIRADRLSVAIVYRILVRGRAKRIQLSAQERDVLHVANSWCRVSSTGLVRIAWPDWVADTGMSRQTVQGVVMGLCRRRWLELVERGGGRRANSYRMYVPLRVLATAARQERVIRNWRASRSGREATLRGWLVAHTEAPGLAGTLPPGQIPVASQPDRERRSYKNKNNRREPEAVAVGHVMPAAQREIERRQAAASAEIISRYERGTERLRLVSIIDLSGDPAEKARAAEQLAALEATS